MPPLVVAGVEIPVALSGGKRSRNDNVDRSRMFDNTMKVSQSGTAKRTWDFSTPPMHRNDADLLEGILAGVAAKTVSGDLIGGGSNLALWSEEADNAAWTKTTTTVTPNVSAAPDGLGGMDAVIETAVNAIHSISRVFTAVLGQQYTFAVYVRPNGRTKASLVIGAAGGFQQVFFDVPNLTVTSNVSGGGAALGTPAVRDVGGERYRISLTGVAVGGDAAATYEFRLLDAAGSQTYLGTGLDMHVWGMQFNEGPLQSYVKTTTAAVPLPTVSCFSEITGWEPVKDSSAHLVVGSFSLYEV